MSPETQGYLARGFVISATFTKMPTTVESKNTHAGRLFLVTAPSGAGKSSLVNALLKCEPSVSLSISHTTRQPRPGEENGREYHFVSEAEFLAMEERQEFLESALVHGNYYGTSRLWIERQIAQGKDVLLEIDWQGARQVRKHFQDTVGIFILPPSIEALEWRLHHRGTDSEQTITRRLLAAGAEMAHAPEFEYVIINDDFEVALEQLRAIVIASRLAYKYQALRHRKDLVALGIPL